MSTDQHKKDNKERLLDNEPVGMTVQVVRVMGDGAFRQRLLEMGIQGLEAYYSGFTPKLTAEILGLADQCGLYVTAGSDYHGTNKLIPLGDTNLDEADEIAPGLERFLQDVTITL